MEAAKPPPKPPKPPAKPPKPAVYQTSDTTKLPTSSTDSIPNSRPPPPPPPPPPPASSSNSATKTTTTTPPLTNSTLSTSSINSPLYEFRTYKNETLNQTAIDEAATVTPSKRRSLQSTLIQFTEKLGIKDNDIEYTSKSYSNENDEVKILRLQEINNAIDGLDIISNGDDDNNNGDTTTTKTTRSSSISEGRKSITQQTIGNNLIREGYLFKTNRDGMEKYYFILTSQYFTYCSEKLLSSQTKLIHKRSIPLATLMCQDAHHDFKINKNNISMDELITFKNKTILILSKEKSFHITSSTIEDRNNWFHDLQQASRTVHHLENICLSVEVMSPVWNPDYSTTACELCSTEFTLFFRRHHCRNCGKCLCENCCHEKIRIPRIDSRKLLLVCNFCANQLKSTRNYGVPSYVPQLK